MTEMKNGSRRAEELVTGESSTFLIVLVCEYMSNELIAANDEMRP